MEERKPERASETNGESPRIWPLGVTAPTMLVVAALAAGGGFLAWRFFGPGLWGTAGLVVGLIAASAALTVLLASVWEALEVRRWNRRCCPGCGERYRVPAYSEATFWSVRGPSDRERPDSGVILLCAACGRAGHFTRSGEVVADKALLEGLASAEAAGEGSPPEAGEGDPPSPEGDGGPQGPQEPESPPD